MAHFLVTDELNHWSRGVRLAGDTFVDPMVDDAVRTGRETSAAEADSNGSFMGAELSPTAEVAAGGYDPAERICPVRAWIPIRSPLPL